MYNQFIYKQYYYNISVHKGVKIEKNNGNRFTKHRFSH